MIEKTHKTKNKIAHLAKKFYYLVMDSNNPVGCATNYEAARLYLLDLATKKKAVCLMEDIYSYNDSTGNHLLTIQTVIRIKE